MKPPTLNCARALRDGGIDAVAALNDALRDALVDLSPEHGSELKRAFGEAMAAILEVTLHPAVHAFPELDPDEATWIAIAKARASARAAMSDHPQ
jgi:hypothetical protein